MLSLYRLDSNACLYFETIIDSRRVIKIAQGSLMCLHPVFPSDDTVQNHRILPNPEADTGITRRTYSHSWDFFTTSCYACAILILPRVGLSDHHYHHQEPRVASSCPAPPHGHTHLSPPLLWQTLVSFLFLSAWEGHLMSVWVILWLDFFLSALCSASSSLSGCFVY